MAAKILVPFGRTRKSGMRGRDVQQDRRALTRAGYWPLNTTTKPATFYDRAEFTPKLSSYVKRYQRAKGLRMTGEVDRATHNSLATPYKDSKGRTHAYGHYGAAGSKVMDAVAKKLRAQEQLLLNTGSVTSRGVAAALMTVRHRGNIHYTQGAARNVGIRGKGIWPPDYPHYADCSMHDTWLYFVAGAPDPNRRGYDGFGFTGTQSNAGVTVSWRVAPLLALVFYGHPIGHVATVVKKAKLVVSHGSEVGPVLVAINYRTVTLVKVKPLNVRKGFKPWPLSKAAA